MALAAPLQWSVSTAFKDRDGNGSAVTFYMPQSTAIAQVEIAAGAFYDAAVALSDAQVVGQTISRTYLDSNLTDLAPETSDVERKGLFTFNDAQGYAAQMSIPSIKNSVVVDGSNQINLSDPLVLAFVGAIAGAAVTFRGIDIINLRHAVKVHRGSRKG